MQDVKASTGEKRRLFQEAVLRWVTDQLRDYPWRKPGRSPYEILIAEILLKRTTATAAARVYEDFLHKFPSPQAINDADEEELAQVFSKVGLQWQRAKAVKALAGHLTEVQGGEIPCDLHLLLDIPGLGEYSARAILSFGFGVPVAVVDANVARILTRVFQHALPQKVPQRELQEVADLLVLSESHRKYNLGLLDLGALICRYVAPRCDECTLNTVCDFYRLDAATGMQVVTAIKLREMRLGKGLRLVQLAKKAGISKLTIINIEAGRTVPHPETLLKLAAALEVPTDELAAKRSE